MVSTNGNGKSHQGVGIDADHVRRYLALTRIPGEWFELRVFRPFRARAGFTVEAMDEALGWIEAQDRRGAAGIYVTLSPIRSREGSGEGGMATAADVVRRRLILIDLDAVRPSDTSSTEAELLASLHAADVVEAHLTAEGWPAPIRASSGNGTHLYYRVDLPADDDAKRLVGDLLAGLASRHDTRACRIDRAVYDASRVHRLLGTWARKGPHSEERPHRRSALIYCPDRLDVVPVEVIRSTVDRLSPRDRSWGQVASADGCLPALRASSANGREEAYVAAAVEDACARIASAAPGTRNRTLNAEAMSAFRVASALPGKVDDASARFAEAARQAGLPDPEIASTLRSALAAAEREGPRPIPPPASVPSGRLLSESGSVGVVEDDDDPHRLARLYVVRHQVDGVPGLRWWRQQWHRWREGVYTPVEDSDIRAALGSAIKVEFDRLHRIAAQSHARRTTDEIEGERGSKTKPPPSAQKVSNRLVGDVRAALVGLTLVDGRMEQPSWLDGDGDVPADQLLVCRNGILHLPTWEADGVCLSPLTPRLFTATALPYDFDPSAPTPAKWLEFLGQVWPDDPEAIDTLQEWFGYLLLPDTSQQKIAMLVGPKRAGKGVIARVLTQMIGPGNVCTPTLSTLAENFGLQPLLGKTAAIISEARLSGRSDSAIIIERLLSISGEDAQTIDRKHLTAVTGRLPVRFTILTNELPKLRDASGALVGRLLILRLTQSFYGREDPGLTDRLLDELPGILLWAMEGRKRLRARGRFVLPASSRKLVQQMEDLAGPIGGFVRERCIVGPDQEVAIPAMYDAWKVWAERTGQRAGSEQEFGRDLRAYIPTLDSANRRFGAHRLRYYLGVGLRPDDEEGRWDE